METLRAQHQTAQTESQAQANQSAAMMTLNLKLQSTAVKNQAKAIDLELRRIEAHEGRELLAIVQPYLPQIYIESDSDATNCYLFFQRIAAKGDLINSVVGQIHGLPDSLNGPISENLAMVCEVRFSIAF
jgi:dynactin 1